MEDEKMQEFKKKIMRQRLLLAHKVIKRHVNGKRDTTLIQLDPSFVVITIVYNSNIWLRQTIKIKNGNIFFHI